MVAPEFEPVVGALILAYELEQPVTNSIYNGISDSLPLIERKYNVVLKAGIEL
jgi:hypothetical protein